MESKDRDGRSYAASDIDVGSFRLIMRELVDSRLGRRQLALGA